MTENKRQEYETPMVEQMNAHVEKGFAGSFATGNGAGDGLGEGDELDDEIFS